MFLSSKQVEELLEDKGQMFVMFIVKLQLLIYMLCVIFQMYSLRISVNFRHSTRLIMLLIWYQVRVRCQWLLIECLLQS